MFQARRGSDMVIWGVFIEKCVFVIQGQTCGCMYRIVLEKLLLVVQEANFREHGFAYLFKKGNFLTKNLIYDSHNKVIRNALP